MQRRRKITSIGKFIAASFVVAVLAEIVLALLPSGGIGKTSEVKPTARFTLDRSAEANVSSTMVIFGSTYEIMRVSMFPPPGYAVVDLTIGHERENISRISSQIHFVKIFKSPTVLSVLIDGHSFPGAGTYELVASYHLQSRDGKLSDDELIATLETLVRQ
jgi:hypothetical protein